MAIEVKAHISPVCYFISVLIAVLWLVFSPGPKHEEIYFILGFGVPMFLIALLNSVLAPKPSTVPFLHSSIWLMGWIFWQTRFALHYDYPVLDVSLFVIGVVVFVSSVLVLLTINFVSQYVHSKIANRYAAI